MNQEEIIPGEEYGLREPPRPGIDLQHVRVVERVRPGRWRVEWIDPNPGLVDFVKSSNLIIPWKDRNRFLRDERDLEAITRMTEVAWPVGAGNSLVMLDRGRDRIGVDGGGRVGALKLVSRGSGMAGGVLRLRVGTR